MLENGNLNYQFMEMKWCRNDCVLGVVNVKKGREYIFGTL